MRPPVRRGGEARERSVGTKMSHSEYNRILVAAGALSPSEWLRKVALDAADRQPIERVVLIETLATQRLLMNLLDGRTWDPAMVKKLHAEIDRDKLQRARERLDQAMDRGEDR